MRWIEDAVQKGRDHQAGSDDLLPISIVRQSIERQKKELSRSREEGGMYYCRNLGTSDHKNYTVLN